MEGEAHLRANLVFVQEPAGQYRAEVESKLEEAREAALEAGNGARALRLQLVQDLWSSHMLLCGFLLQRTPEGARQSKERGVPVYFTLPERARAVEAGAKCLRLARTLRWRLTPWLHVLWAHGGQLLQRWGSLWMFGCWGLEARHRLVKRCKRKRLSNGLPVHSRPRFYDLCLKATRRKGTGRLGVCDILQRCVVRTALKRLPNTKVLKRRAPTHARQVVDAAKAKASALLRGPNFAKAVQDLVDRLAA